MRHQRAMRTSGGDDRMHSTDALRRAIAGPLQAELGTSHEFVHGHRVVHPCVPHYSWLVSLGFSIDHGLLSLLIMELEW